MRFITDEEVRSLLTVDETLSAIRAAFLAYGQGAASNLTRVRSTTGGRSISAMGAIVLPIGVMGAKVYPTIEGNFNFCVPLFSSDSGELLAVVQGNALTALRTAATTLLASQYLARHEIRTMTLFGSGVQAMAHASAFIEHYKVRKVYVVDPHGDPAQLAQALAAKHEVQAFATTLIKQALADADVVVTATRSKAPVFEGRLVRPGTFVAAIGSSKPDAREVDDDLLRRCARIGVEVKDQTLQETGDFLLADPSSWKEGAVVELKDLVAGRASYMRRPEDINLYKSVGVGIEDVAVAHAAWRKLASREAA